MGTRSARAIACAERVFTFSAQIGLAPIPRTRFQALIAIVPAAATLYFGAFWSGFEYWRKHAVQTYAMMFGIIGSCVSAAVYWRDELLAHAIAMPTIVQVIGVLVIAAACVLGTIADRQIGFRVRSFMPFFEDRGRIDLVTTGAYSIVRHPIYASGIYFQIGAFLVTGQLSILAACLVFALGAFWFTAQEERRLVGLLKDPDVYARYRGKVPRLIRWR